MSSASFYTKGLHISVQDYTSKHTNDEAVLVRVSHNSADSATAIQAGFDLSPEKAIELAANMDRIAREMIAARPAPAPAPALAGEPL